jgi:hypothetical protein
MPSTAILREARKLHDVSECLGRLADQHPLITESLITIAGNIRSTATLLEVLVMTKMRIPPA